MHETAMCWGFDVGDGWYNIIDVLCASLYYDYRTAKDELKYRSKLVKRSEEMENDLLENPDTKKYYITPIDVERTRLKMVQAMEEIPVADQVKEKYGTLRFYVSNANKTHYKLISMAEHMSAKTCEVCGKPSTPNKERTGWITTRCDDHKNA